MYQSTKRYAEGQGLSCAFRQPKAASHCRYLHGYALSFKFKFEASELDSQNWVVDFGGLKSLRGILETNFDHKTIVCENDPHMAWFKEGQARGVLDLIIVPEAGCEKFAELVFAAADCWLGDAGYKPRVTLVEVEVSEHGGNAAIYINPELDITKRKIEQTKPSDFCCLNFGCVNPDVCDNEIGFSCGDPRATTGGV